MLEFFSILGPARFILCMNDPRNYLICNNAVYAYDTTLYCKFEQASDWWQQLDLLLNLNLTNETQWFRAGIRLLISML